MRFTGRRRKRRISPSFWSIAVLASMVVACGDDIGRTDNPSGLRRSPASVSAGRDRSEVPAETVAAYPFRWDLAAVENALKVSALTARNRGPVTQPFMSVEGTGFRIGAAELQVFIYGDVGAVMRDVIRLDTVRVSPPAMMISWRAKPSLLTTNNLAAIIVTNDEALRRRIRNALTVQPHVGPD